MRDNKFIDVTKLVDELSDVLFYATPLGFLGSSWDDFIFLYQLLKKTPEHKFVGEFWVNTLEDLEKYNMEKLNQRLKETGSHVK